MTSDLRFAEKSYMNMLKLLLGVRLSTCNDLVIVETGFPSVKDFVKDKQLKFLEKLQNRLHFKDSYIKFVLDLAVHKGSPMGRYISNLQHEQPVTSFLQCANTKREENIRSSQSSRRINYCAINPSKCQSHV